jgi:hypothetical protein
MAVMRIIFSCVLATALALISPNSVQAETFIPFLPPEHVPTDPQELKIFKKIHALTLRDTKWEKIDVSAALKDLTQRSKIADPEHIGVKFSLKIPPGKTTGAAGYPIRRLVQNIVLLEETPLADILGYLSSQTNLSYRIERDAIVFSP